MDALLRYAMVISLFTLSLTVGQTQETAGPRAAPFPPPIAAPQDIAYPGTLKLSVDATDLDRRIFRVQETIPVSASGKLTLLFPRWLPGHHSPGGRLDQLAGLVITAGGQRIEWTRDTVEISAFHVTVPAGAKQLELEFQYLSPVEEKEGRIVVTPEMLNLQWDAMVLYPAGYYSSRILFEARVKLPAGWNFGSALETAGTSGGFANFKPVSLETLIDSPIFAGRYYKQFDLAPGATVPVRLNVVADKASALEATSAGLDTHRALVQQAYKLYGGHHYDHYDFLLALSDNLGGIGLEHHRSSENSADPNYFAEWEKSFVGRDLLAHEFTHAWNGKFRRPADLWTPNYNVPMRTSLLWVYEGQTQYWGYVLAARSGLLTKQQTLDAIAETAAAYDQRVGRSWRAMQDTTNDPIISGRRPIGWRSWQRSEDYYSEGQLIWLDADTLIREQTKGAKSLDNFARAFFGIADGSYTPVTYTFDDVVQTLNNVVPHDWATFLRTRVEGHGPGAPLDGLKRGGYQLVYRDKPSDFSKANDAARKRNDYSYSLGFTLNKEGVLIAVTWEGLAFKAGLAVGAKVVALNGKEFNADDLKDVITAATSGSASIEFLVKTGDRYRTVAFNYHDGLRYPHLERIANTAATLDEILNPKP